MMIELKCWLAEVNDVGRVRHGHNAQPGGRMELLHVMRPTSAEDTPRAPVELFWVAVAAAVAVARDVRTGSLRSAILGGVQAKRAPVCASGLPTAAVPRVTVAKSLAHTSCNGGGIARSSGATQPQKCGSPPPAS